MKYLVLVGLLTSLLFNQAIAQNKVRLYGVVTDFSGNPLDSVSVRLKDRSFNNIYETLSDKNGSFSMWVEKGDYYCLYAIKISDYRKTKLEYWAWNVPVWEDLEINPQYNNMEIYGINVFEPQVTPQETYMIYFRPMSLLKTLKFAEEQKINKKSFEKAKKTESLIESNRDNIINIAPEKITEDELSIKINGVKAEILNINKIKEYGRGFYFYAYCVQVLKPRIKSESGLKYDKVSIILNSKETSEIGKAEAFVKRSSEEKKYNQNSH